MRARFLACILAASVAGATIPTGVVFAQGMDADTKEAKTLFEDGVKLYKASKFEEARVKFKAAYGLKKRVSIVLNLAHAELMTSRPQDAATHFREVIGMSEAKDDDKSDAKQGLADARKQLAVIVIDAPSSATVTIDGSVVANVPADGIELAPGTHTVAVKTSAGENVEKVDVAAGATQTVKGKDATTTTTTTPPVDTTTTTTTTPPTDTTTPKETPKETTGQHLSFFETVHPVTYVTAGATVLFAALWIGYYGARNTHSTNIDKLSAAINGRTAADQAAGKNPADDAQIESWKAQGRSEVSSFNSDKNLAVTFGVLTGVSAAATVVTYFLLRKKDTNVAFGAAPNYGGGATFTLAAAF